MIGQVQTINGVKQAIPISGAIPTGLPVGTWISFEKDQAPDNKWIKAGETFNASDYPALYLFLGGNVVPERFDHNRLGDYQSITIGTTYATAFEMAFDGVLVVNENPNTNSGGMGQVYVDNVRVAISSSTNGSQNGNTLVLRKGQKVHLSLSNAGQISFVAYFNHPMFIKATSAIEITDQNTFLQTVKDYVDAKTTWTKLIDRQEGGTFTLPDSATEVNIVVFTSRSESRVAGNLNCLVECFTYGNLCMIPANDTTRSRWNISNSGKTFTFADGYNCVSVYYK